MQNNNFKKVSSLSKLSEIIQNEVGKVTKSYFQHNDGKVISDTIKLLAQSSSNLVAKEPTIESEDEKFDSGNDQGPNERANFRKAHQSQKKQLNIENVTAFASDELTQDSEVTSEPVDEDWISRFFSIAEDVSNEEMQALWGRVLAGEIKQPSSFSLRTLEMLKALTKTEADVITKMANLVIESSGTYFIFNENENDKLNQFGLSFGMITLLVELGIIQPGDFIQYQLKNGAPQYHFIFGKTLVLAKRGDHTSDSDIPIYLLTKVGRQLLRLMNIEAPFEYLKCFGAFLETRQFEMSFSEITNRDSEMIQYKQPLLKFPK